MHKLSLFTFLAAASLLGPIETATGANLAPEDVRNALNIGVRYLRSSQHENNGTWSEYPGQEGGITCLCTLALLNAGESPDEPHVAKALAYIRRLDPRTTYVSSLQTMVLCRAVAAIDKERLPRKAANQEVIAQRPVAGKHATPIQELPARPQRRLVVRRTAQREVRCRRRLEQPVCPPGPVRGRPRGRGRQGQCRDQRRYLEAGPHLLDQQPARGRRLLGLLQAHGRHRKHDLCGHFLARDYQRRAPRTRRQGFRRRDRRLLSGALGRPRPDRPRASTGCGGISRSTPIRPRRPHWVPAPASGTTISCTGWSVREGSRRGGRSANTIGTVKGPTTSCRPWGRSSRGIPGKAAVTPRTTRTSPPAWPCSSSPRDDGRCSWPRCNIAARKRVPRPGR